MVMQPQIMYKPGFRVLGILLDGEDADAHIDRVWDQLAAHYAEIPQVDPDQGFGVHRFSEEGHLYLAGFALWQDGYHPDGLVEWAINPHAYAVFSHRGLAENLGETVASIFDAWLPGSGYQLAEDFYFELYDDHFQPGSADSVIFIFVPVVEAYL